MIQQQLLSPLNKQQDTNLKSFKKYEKINYQTRIELINNVTDKGMSLLKSARILKIKPSTAKYILKSYLNDKHVFMRKDEIYEIKKTKRMKQCQDVVKKTVQSQKSVPESLIVVSPVFIPYPFFSVIFNPSFAL